jgi:hypothetical protein
MANQFLNAQEYANTMLLLAKNQLVTGKLVTGKFKTAFQDDEFQCIPTQWIIEAQNRWTNNRPAGVDMTAMGVDIAQGGADRSVIAPRYGSWFAPLLRRRRHRPAHRPESPAGQDRPAHACTPWSRCRRP